MACGLAPFKPCGIWRRFPRFNGSSGPFLRRSSRRSRVVMRPFAVRTAPPARTASAASAPNRAPVVGPRLFDYRRSRLTFHRS